MDASLTTNIFTTPHLPDTDSATYSCWNSATSLDTRSEKYEAVATQYPGGANECIFDGVSEGANDGLNDGANIQSRYIAKQ